MEKSRATLQNQFDSWYNALHARDGQVLNHSSRSEIDAKRHSSEMNQKVEQFRESPRGNNFIEEKQKKLMSNVSDSDGEDEVNEDIMAFYKAKEELLKRRGGAG